MKPKTEMIECWCEKCGAIHDRMIFFANAGSKSIAKKSYPRVLCLQHEQQEIDRWNKKIGK